MPASERPDYDASTVRHTPKDLPKILDPSDPYYSVISSLIQGWFDALLTRGCTALCVRAQEGTPPARNAPARQCLAAHVHVPFPSSFSAGPSPLAGARTITILPTPDAHSFPPRR